MLPNKKIATEVMPPVLVAIAALLLVGRTAAGIWERFHPVEVNDLVEWREPAKGMAESKASGKSVFIYFTATYKPDKDLEYKKRYFSDPKIAAEINQNYIPVKVVDRFYTNEGIEEPLVVEMEEKYLQWYSMPAIHVVPVEYQYVQPERYRLPHFYSVEPFQNRQSMYSFLGENKNWHPLPASPSTDVKWVKLSDAQKVAAHEHKPVLYFFARYNEHSSSEAMNELFSDNQCKHDNLKKFVCCMVYDHKSINKSNTPEVDALLKKYKVSIYPTFLVERNGNSNPTDKVTGYHGHDSMEEFLATELKESASQTK